MNFELGVEMCTTDEACRAGIDRILDRAEKAAEGIAPHELALDRAREASITCDGLQLSSHYSREALAERQLRGTDPSKDVWIYGTGIGDAVRLAASRATGGARVHAVILCPRLFCQLCGTDAFDGLFGDGKISFELPEENARPEPNRAVSFPELMLEPMFANTLKASLRCALDEEYAKNSFNRGAGARLEAAAKANLPALLQEKPYDASALPRCETAAVLCSGPSLKEDFPKLEKWLDAHPGTLVIAVETSLIFLEQTSLVPECIVSIDDLAGSRAGDLYMRDPSRYRGSTLIFAASSPRRLWEPFAGKRRYLTTKRIAKAVPELPPSSALYSSGSVALAAVSLALSAGAREIALLGADFAYDGSFSHAGIPINGDPLTGTVGKIPVMCNDGRIRPTQRNFLAYREDMEALIASRPDVRFANLSSHGAVVKGAQKI
jgi:hypothetical protein